MRCPPKDFRDHFKRVVERAVWRTDNSMRFLRDKLDFVEFMTDMSPSCPTPRALALAFMVQYFAVYLHPTLAQALYLAMVQYLAERSGRLDVDDDDVRALQELGAIEYKTERELTHWIDSHFPQSR